MLKRVLFLIIVCAAVACSICMGLRLGGAPEQSTSLGRVSVSLHPSAHGRVEVYTPLTDWGVAAHAFTAPASIRIEPRALNRPALMQLAGEPGPLLSQTEKDLQDAVWNAAWRAMIWIVLAGFLLAGPLLLLARRWGFSARWAFVPPAGAFTVSLLVGSIAWISFNPQAFNDPTYWAKGEELPQLIDFAHQAHRSSSSYEGSVRHGIRELAGVLSGKPAGTRSNDSMILMSDLHNNVLALRSVRQLVDQHPVFFVGDFAHEGVEEEQKLILPALQGLGNPMIAVSGNHDSEDLMRRISRSSVVLGTRGRLNESVGWDGVPIYRQGKLRVMGLEDPLEAKGGEGYRSFSLTQQQKEEQVEEWLPLIRQNNPDVLLVHQSGLAELLARRLHDKSLLILTGHDHQQHVDRYGKVVVVDGGSVGAGGLLGAGRQYVGLAKLYFNGQKLRAVDLVRLEPIRGSGESQRIVLDNQCRKVDRLRCRYVVTRSADHP